MLMRLLFPALLFFSITSYAQINQRLAGLKTGVWKEKYTSTRGRELADGSYIIIPADSFPVVRKLDKTTWEVKYFGSTPLLSLSGESMGNISVKNGLWTYHNPEGILLEEVSWISGIESYRKAFDSKGQIVEWWYSDFVNDTSFFLDYREGRLYRKSWYPPEDKNFRRSSIYYPESIISISNAEPSFWIRFGEKTADTVEILVTAKKETLIQSISVRQSSIEYKTADGLPFPRTVSPGSPLQLKLITHPSPASYRLYDTLVLRTPEEPIRYKIYCDIHAAHLSASDVGKIKNLKLSRSRDKYLVVTGTDVAMMQGKTLLRLYDLDKIKKIDLSEYAVGTYDLEVSSCSSGGLIKLVITE